MQLRVISWLMRSFLSACSLFCPLLWLSCAQPTDSTDEEAVDRERIEVSGLIMEDTVWESGKESYVTGDVIVKAGAWGV